MSVERGMELSHTHFAVVRYEDLLTDPEPELRRLWTMLGVEPASAELKQAVAQELHTNPEADWHGSFGYDFLQKLPRGVHGGWRSLFTAADEKLFEEEARRVLETYGYLGSA